MQGHWHDDRLDQHHQLEHLADTEQHHEQRHPGQGRDLRQGIEGWQYQAFGATAETQPGTEQGAADDAHQQAQGQALQADRQVRPQLALGQLQAALPDQARCRQYLFAHPLVATGQPPQCCQ
ncbi:hypothetical protein D3C85_1313320 [compost metagenome]